MNENNEEKPSEPPQEKEMIVTLQDSLKECQDKYLHLLADSENARKRMQKERGELTKYAVENVLAELLHPLDSFEKALQFAESMSTDIKNWALGFEMILNQLKQVLYDQGVREYESVGKHFDPHFHEAVEVVETTEVPAGIIIQEFVKGYRTHDRPIRVARVKVAKAPENPKEENNQNQELSP